MVNRVTVPKPFHPSVICKLGNENRQVNINLVFYRRFGPRGIVCNTGIYNGLEFTFVYYNDYFITISNITFSEHSFDKHK